MSSFPMPQKGERALILGRTGSGKTAFATWMLRRVEESPIIIYDTKIEPKFEALPYSVVIEDFKNILELIEKREHDYIILRPSLHLMDDPETLDKFLLYHYHHLQGLVAYIDEAYTFHIRGKAGKGLIALLTRGRSKGITTIISSQRPKWLDRFCISEAQKIFVFRLIDREDRKRLDDVIPDFSEMPVPAAHHFYAGDLSEMEPPRLFSPVRLDDTQNTGYSDDANSVPTGTTGAKKSPIWI